MAVDPTRVLFVCLGNICRSPLAENVFRDLAERRGVAERFEVDSAGTSGYHDGDPPDARTSATARARGLHLTGRSRRLTPGDLARFDYVIAMDAENQAAIERLRAGAGGGAKVHRLREWDREADSLDVPDPYYGGTDGFERVHDLVARACAALLEDLLARESA